MATQRFDIGSFRKATRTPQGFLKADAYATRVGVFSYQTADGKIFKEFRPAEEVFKEDSLKSLAEVPVTNDHPPEFVTAKNAKSYAAGFTGADVEKEGNFVKVAMTVMDQKTIADMTENKKLETSCGYLCDLDMTPGEYNGEKYDAVQRNIVYNHLAIVDRGRAGPDVRVRLDGGMVIADNKPEITENKKDSTQRKAKIMAKIKIDSVEYEIEDSGLAQLMTKKADELTVVKGDLQKLQGKCDALESDIKSRDAKIKDLEAKVVDESTMMIKAKARLNLDSLAVVALQGEKTEQEIEKLDALTLKKLVIAKAKPDMNLDGKDDLYIEGVFEAVKDSFSRADDTKVSNAFRKHATDGVKNQDSITEIRKKQMAEDSQAWKKPVNASAA